MVDWAHLMWHKDHVPRCSIICWLACKNRPGTKDRLLQWGMNLDARCVLCGVDNEDRNHVFLQLQLLQTDLG